MDFKKMAEEALERRANLVSEMRGLNDVTDLSDAEKRERIERINSDIAAAEADARSYVEQGERESEFRALAERAGTLGLALPGEAGEKRAAKRDLDAELRSILLGEQRGALSVQGSGGLEHRIGLTTQTANAGTTIEDSFVAQIIDSLREHSPILRAGAKVITTSKGNRMDWPVKNARLTGSRLVAENTAQTFSNMGFSRISLDAFKYTVGAEMSEEMLRDSELPLASLIASDIGEELGFLTTKDFVNGTGTGEPEGLLTGTTLGLTGGTIANTLTFDNLIRLQHSVVPRYRGSSVFYTSDSAVLTLRLIKDNDGRYIYQDPTVAGTEHGTLLGKPVWVDVEMPAANAASKSIVVFGDMSKGFLVRFVSGVDVQRSDEYGWERDVVAWKGRVYADSVRTDAAALAYLKTPAT